MSGKWNVGPEYDHRSDDWPLKWGAVEIATVNYLGGTDQPRRTALRIAKALNDMKVEPAPLTDTQQDDRNG